MENEARVGQLAVLFELSASETVQGIGSAGRQVTEEELPGAALHKEVRARMERLSRGVARILGTPKEFLNASVQFLKLRRHFCRPLRNRSAGGRDNAVGEKRPAVPQWKQKDSPVQMPSRTASISRGTDGKCFGHRHGTEAAHQRQVLLALPARTGRRGDHRWPPCLWSAVCCRVAVVLSAPIAAIEC